MSGVLLRFKVAYRADTIVYNSCILFQRQCVVSNMYVSKEWRSVKYGVIAGRAMSRYVQANNVPKLPCLP